MIGEERIAASLAGLGESSRHAILPVLRVIIHDLNGVLSVVTMESFAVEKLATSLGSKASARSTEERQQRESLRDSTGNLRQAADRLATYLARIEALADGLEGKK